MWLRWELERRRISESPPDVADVLLVTTTAPTQRADVRALTKGLRGTVIVGGHGALSPAAFDDVAHMCCVGEGTRFIDTLLSDGLIAAAELPETWLPGDDRIVTPAHGFPWDMPPLNHPDGIVRIFHSRGCKHRCLFCQVGWAAPYEVNPDLERMAAQVHYLQDTGRRVAVVTNDGAVPEVLALKGQAFLSGRYEGLRSAGVSGVKVLRIGVEGVSERLRAAVGKPILTSELVTSVAEWSRKSTVRLFFIAGLPGETEADWLEFRALVESLGRHVQRLVQVHLHAFIPEPATPLGIMPMIDEYREHYRAFADQFFAAPLRRIQLVPPAGYETRLKRAKQHMWARGDGSYNGRQLREGWLDVPNPNWRCAYKASPDALRERARRYLREVGDHDERWQLHRYGSVAPHPPRSPRT